MIWIWKKQPDGYLPNPVMPWLWQWGLLVRQIRNYRERAVLPGRGWCLRCGALWKGANEHHISYRFPDSTRDEGLSDGGVFPVCQRCWEELKTPSRRWPFYAYHLDSSSHREPEVREAVRRAVMEGK